MVTTYRAVVRSVVEGEELEEGTNLIPSLAAARATAALAGVGF